MSKHNKYIGDKGEQFAIDHLVDNGYQVIGQKVFTKSGEIDIIAVKNTLTHFIEVKSRTTDEMGYPEQAVTPKKRARMALCAEEFASEHDTNNYQLDVIAIMMKKDREPELVHFENV